MEFFKGDAEELKYFNSMAPILDILAVQRNEFLSDAFNAYDLGAIIFDGNRSPLSNAIDRNIFRSSFNEIFTSFVNAGTFESYISIFKKIFGDSVLINFVVPGPGRLQINIEAAGVELNKFVAREIVDNAYVFDYVVDAIGDNIAFATVKGFESQYELEQMLFELVPGGIFTEIDLETGV